MAHQASAHECGACHKPMTDAGALCWDCIDEQHGLRDLLSRLTCAAIGAERPGSGPLRATVTPGESGYQVSTAWDTPYREASNLPRMLREQKCRQTRFSASAGTRTKGGETPSVAVDYKAQDHLRRLESILARIAKDVMAATGTVPDVWTWGGIARWVDRHMDRLRMLPSAPVHLADLRRATVGAEAHVDRPPSRRYLGPCVAASCGGEYLADPDATEATCRICKATVNVAAHRSALLDQAAAMWLPAVDIERLTAELGERVPDSTVDSWRRRGQIQSTGSDPTRYLLADVLAKIEARKQRRAS